MAKSIYRVEIEDNDIDISPTIEEAIEKNVWGCKGKINVELIKTEED